MTGQGGDMKGVAFHEAAHAAVALWYGHEIGPTTIIPEGDYDGMSCGPGMIPEDIISLARKPQKAIFGMEFIQILLAGVTAERLITRADHCIPGSFSDREKIEILIYYLCSPSGVISQEASSLKSWLQVRTIAILKTIWPSVEAIANELLLKKTITAKQARKIYDDAQGAK